MSGDYSRLSTQQWLGDKPLPIYDGSLLQQGRPLTDRDWNELVAQLNRRDQAGTLDAAGPVTVSKANPNAFMITRQGSDVKIQPGRIYVDGLLAENRGTGNLAWDPALAEQYGEPVSYLDQPFLPDPEFLPPKSYLVYLDVWQREVTHAMDEDIVEQALGVDTTTRLQTVWQVKFTQGGSGISCATPLGFKSSSGRLSTDTADVPDDSNPCLVPPVAGYKGLENQLYRVEIHDGGGLGAATFKWSRDNASVEARVVEVIDDSQIVVESLGKDDVLRFLKGNWVEITDNDREFTGAPGDVRKI